MIWWIRVLVCKKFDVRLSELGSFWCIFVNCGALHLQQGPHFVQQVICFTQYIQVSCRGVHIYGSLCAFWGCTRFNFGNAICHCICTRGCAYLWCIVLHFGDAISLILGMQLVIALAFRARFCTNY